MPQSIASFLAFLLATSTYMGSLAQLLSCSDVGCPQGAADQALNANCPLGNEVLFSVGIANLSTSLDPRPLEWTVGISDYDDITASSKTLNKEFYLGQPSSLALQNATSVMGCAIFFTGLTPTLHFNDVSNGKDHMNESGTCDDALGAECVKDWTTAMQDSVSLALQDATLDCDSLAQTLRDSPPPSCASSSGSFGEVSARTLTGPSSPPPLVLSSCHPTVNDDYSITHLVNSNASFQRLTSPEPFNWLYGVTPIATVFVPSDLDSAAPGPALSGIETHLTCVKVMKNSYAPTGSVLESQAGTHFPPAVFLAIFAGSFAWYLAGF